MANELELKYGCNPNQKPARIFMKEGELPIEVLNGRPGYTETLSHYPTLVTKKQHASSTVKYPTESLLLTILPKHWRF